MISSVSWLSIRLGDISLEMVLVGLLAFLITAVLLGVTVIVHKVKADDKCPERQVRGRVIEKRTEQDGVAGVMTIVVEWVVVEDAAGNRRSYRNMRPREMIIKEGDYCKLIVRGNTIYAYEKDK